jgi:hypothetical protein
MALQISGSVRSVRLTIFIGLVASSIGISAFCQDMREASGSGSPGQDQPVLVELFTSEGCSDCPPADALLERLDTSQFVPGAKAIVLSEHVTYWNHLGWSDPFSLDAVTERQQEYKFRFNLNDVYTPQMVVDGADQFVGSDADKLTAALAHAAATSKAKITIENAHWEGGALSFSVHAENGSSATLVAALAQNATSSKVAHGENAGRTLHHVAVVRSIKEFGAKAADGRPLRLSGSISSGTDKTATPLRLVVFLADRKTGHILAVTEQTLGQ